MHESLLKILAEPVTGSPLRLTNEHREGDNVVAGDLVSDASGKRFPIVRGIPRFVESNNYTRSFGMQWNKFRRVQIDSETGTTHSKQRFDTETAWAPSSLKGAWVLDAGCGAGRFAQVAANAGARLVAFDYSSAVDAAQQTLQGQPNVDVVQGNLLEPPFRMGAFDFAYCIGVVQHTPDRSAVIRNVIHCVRPGGQFAFSIYARRPWTKLNAKYLIRPLTTQLDQAKLLRAIEAVMPVMFPLTDALFRRPLIGRVARFAIPVANYDRGDFSREQRYQEAVLDTFDMLSPKFDVPMTWREVEKAIRATAAAQWTFQTKVPVNVVGVR